MKVSQAMSCTPSCVSTKENGIEQVEMDVSRRTVHEFEEFINYCFKKFPMCAKKSRILTNNVHNIRCNDSLVIFATFLFAETKQFLGAETELSNKIKRTNIDLL